MRFETFVGQVQHRARLPSQGDALRAMRAALETLGDRINREEADCIASQLPHEVGEYLRKSDKDLPERFSIRDYYARVAQIENADVPAATFHARAVMSVLCDAVSSGEIDDLMAQLPAEFYPLFSWTSATAA